MPAGGYDPSGGGWYNSGNPNDTQNQGYGRNYGDQPWDPNAAQGWVSGNWGSPDDLRKADELGFMSSDQAAAREQHRYRRLGGEAQGRRSLTGDIRGNQLLQEQDKANAQQQQNADYLKSVMMGTAGPSLAELQMKQGTDSALKAQLAAANSARGGGASYAAAQRSAMDQGGALQQQNVAQTGMLRAKEQMDARAMYANQLQQMRQQQLGAYGAYGLQRGTEAEMNDRYQQAMEQMGQNAEIARANHSSGQYSQQLQREQFHSGQNQANANQGWAAAGAAAQYGASAIGGADGGGGDSGDLSNSDETNKTGIKPIGQYSGPGASLSPVNDKGAETHSSTISAAGPSSSGSTKSSGSDVDWGKLAITAAGIAAMAMSDREAKVRAMRIGEARGREQGRLDAQYNSWDGRPVAPTMPMTPHEREKEAAYMRQTHPTRAQRQQAFRDNLLGPGYTESEPVSAIAPPRSDYTEHLARVIAARNTPAVAATTPGTIGAEKATADIDAAYAELDRATADRKAKQVGMLEQANRVGLPTPGYGQPLVTSDKEAKQEAKKIGFIQGVQRALTLPIEEFAEGPLRYHRRNHVPMGKAMQQVAAAVPAPPPAVPEESRTEYEARLAAERGPRRDYMALPPPPAPPPPELPPPPQNLTSDEAMKSNKERTDIDSFLEHLQPYEYEYKDPQRDGEGKQFGIMAQDLEKSRMGQSMVYDTPRGKMVDTRKAALGGLAALSDEHRRLDRLEHLVMGRR